MFYRLGRCQVMDDLLIAGEFDPKQIRCSIEAKIESNKLNERALKLEECEKSFFNDKSFLIGYINIRSLRPHLQLLLQEENMLQCDIIGLGETWLNSNDEVEVPSFFSACVNNGRGKGIASLTKEQPKMKEEINEQFYSMIKFQIGNKIIIFVYISKEANSGDYIKDIENLIANSNYPTVLIGDVNWKATQQSHPMYKFMTSKNFTQLVQEPTHIHGNTIDHVYVNTPMKALNVQVYVEPLYYISDHVALFVKIA